ncbi:hypothetical protein [Cryobacterium fucosi]|uniref:Glycosyltransferase RgtA/B/C/D-like domain-containing protein n=1 Tax=Cryobacterium fucosi TaxID=1259157 RepID=A0A4R9BFE9_9MICO|nr:hypothetical protein [Cryobacterium fucosi]TFD82681.1 hypothetical protein E3T48_01645 [Cryobacterium fucosi]
MPLLALLILSVAFVTVHVPQNHEFSPYDEYVYLDYLSKVPTQGFIRSGEETGELARQEISCRGVAGYGSFGGTCRENDFADAKYPYSGHTGADLYTPMYFAFTWALAQPLTGFGMTLLDAGRTVGAVWLSLGVLLLYRMLIALRIGRKVAFGFSAFVIATPIAFWSSTYLSTDAPSLALAAGLGLVSLRIGRGQSSWLWLPTLSAVAVLFKVQNLAAVTISALALLIVAAGEERRASADNRSAVLKFKKLVRRPSVLAALSAPIVAIGAQVAWMLFRASSAIPDVPTPQIDVELLSLTPTAAAVEAFRFLGSVGAASMSSSFLGFVAASALTLVTVGGVMTLVLMPRQVPVTQRAIAASLFIVALGMGPALTVATTLVAGYYFPLPERYGVVLLPAFIACGAYLLSHHSGRTLNAISATGAVFAIAAIGLS